MVTRAVVLIVLGLLAMRPALAAFDSGCAAFDRGAYQAARAAWEPLPKQGHAQAQFHLGCLFAFGQGVAGDYGMALRLFRLARRGRRAEQARRPVRRKPWRHAG